MKFLAAKDTAFSQNITLNAGGKVLMLDMPIVMGILNTTPDSFYDGGRYTNEKTIITRAKQIIEEGGKIIDVGGFSSRPGAQDVPEEEEIKRTAFAIQTIKNAFPDSIVSIDTFRASVAEKALNAGADIVNDISAGTLDSNMFPFIISTKVPYIMMHMRGTPRNMTKFTSYKNIIQEIIAYFYEKITLLQSKGVKDLIVDPGFGFAKTREQNFHLLAHLDELKILERPIMVGISRKSMIYKTLNITPDQALNGTTALHMAALSKGASILRVHDVKEAVETVLLHHQLLKNE